tara:strand:- start:52485 stop:54230 length:1746 start_codon:yes stop_codon:yes gene_type:complete
MTKRIIFTENIPNELGIQYSDYYFNNKLKNATYIDLEINISANIKLWTDEIDKWHADLCELGSKAVGNWWILPGTRLISWTPPYSQPLIFALSLLIEIENTNSNVLYISNAPLEVIEYISELAPSIVIEFDISNHKQLYIKQSKLVDFKKIIKLILQIILNYFRTNIPLEQSYKIGIYTQITSLNTLYSSDDHFFGNKLDSLDSTLWLIHSHFREKQNKLIKKYFNSKKRKHLILQETLSFIDLIKILKINLKIKKQLSQIKNNVPVLNISQFKSKHFASSFFNNLIANYSALIEIETLVSTNNIFKSVSLNKVLYPFEDKGLERAILDSCVDCNIFSIGYAHAVANEGHLYFKKRTNKKAYSPRPNLLACTGPGAVIWQNKVANQPLEKLIDLGTKRFEILPNTNKEFPLETVNVLFLVGLTHELQRLSHWVESDPNIFKKIKLTIRKYPFGDIQEQNRYIEKIRKHHLEVIENDLSLIEQISQCDIALFSSTSAGYEAILAGKIGIYAELGHIFRLSSIDKRGNCESIFQCNNGYELKSTLSQICSFSKSDYFETVEKQVEFAKSVYAPSKFELLHTIS